MKTKKSPDGDSLSFQLTVHLNVTACELRLEKLGLVAHKSLDQRMLQDEWFIMEKSHP